MLEQIYDGKTKSVFVHGEDEVLIAFKDDVTGTAEGIDPGGNDVVGTVAGKGLAALQQSVYFFELLRRSGVPTHFVSADLERGTMIAKKAQWFGIEIVVRYRAFGSFVRRYGKYVEEGQPLLGLVEITLKDDERGDPLILDEALDTLGIMPLAQVQETKALVRKAADIIRDDLAAKGAELLDMKFECGVVDGRMVIIDDISTDNMRVVQAGRPVGPAEMLALATKA